MNLYQNVYFQNQVKTVNREKILIMIYDSALLFLRQAREAGENGNKIVKIEKKEKLLKILTELSKTLNVENGGEVAIQLDNIYRYMIKELIRSNTKDDPEFLNVVERILMDLRGGWIGEIPKNRPEPKTEFRTVSEESADPKQIFAAV